jgi:hypothetical protein
MGELRLTESVAILAPVSRLLAAEAPMRLLMFDIDGTLIQPWNGHFTCPSAILQCSDALR